MRKLLNVKLQADDVPHRQISNKADLLSLDEAPPRAGSTSSCKDVQADNSRHERTFVRQPRVFGASGQV